MNFFWGGILPLPLAFIIDLIVGDPPFLYHPIRVVGWVITYLEYIIRRMFPKSSKGELWGGIVLAVVVPLLFFTIYGIFFYVIYQQAFLLFVIMQIVCSFQILAVHNLKSESMPVANALITGDIPAARLALSRIVGRDTDKMNEEDIIKATVETISENTTDGVVAPLIYIALGGAALGIFYKAINTLDSMVGYKNKTYQYFGTASAKLDDVINFLPARVAAIFMILASVVCGYHGKQALTIFKRDRHNHDSPNSGCTESVCAGALGIALGGGGYYDGQWKAKLSLGDATRRPIPDDIIAANRLMQVTALLTVLFITICKLVIWCIII